MMVISTSVGKKGANNHRQEPPSCLVPEEDAVMRSGVQLQRGAHELQRGLCDGSLFIHGQVCQYIPPVQTTLTNLYS